MLNYNYDKKFDVLYLSFNNTNNSYGEEKTTGVVILKDLLTERITGATLFGFMEKYKSNNLPKIELPEKINFKKIFTQLFNS